MLTCRPRDLRDAPPHAGAAPWIAWRRSSARRAQPPDTWFLRGDGVLALIARIRDLEAGLLQCGQVFAGQRRPPSPAELIELIERGLGGDLVTRAEREQRFPIGCRVRLTPLAIAAGLSKSAPTGIVVGHSHRDDAIRVRRDGRKRVLLLWCGWWEPIDG